MNPDLNPYSDQHTTHHQEHPLNNYLSTLPSFYIHLKPHPLLRKDLLNFWLQGMLILPSLWQFLILWRFLNYNSLIQCFPPVSNIPTRHPEAEGEVGTNPTIETTSVHAEKAISATLLFSLTSKSNITEEYFSTHLGPWTSHQTPLRILEKPRQTQASIFPLI